MVMTRVLLAVVAGLVWPVPLPAAGPADTLLQLAPPDTTVVLVVQNPRGVYRDLSESPFVRWLPTTAAGRRLLAWDMLEQVRDVAAEIRDAVRGIPGATLEDVLGEALVFAYTPAPAGRPADERAVLLLRPTRLETLAALVRQVNEAQIAAGKLTAVVRHGHGAGEYFERREAGGASEFYAFCDGVFVYSGSRADVQAVLDRHRPAGVPRPAELPTRLRQLGAADATIALLVNPRAFDAEVKARVDTAPPQEKQVHQQFARVWAALEAVAFTVRLDTTLELGVSLRYQSGQLPAGLRPWLTGPFSRVPAADLIPDHALFGCAGHTRLRDLIDLFDALAPEPRERGGLRHQLGELFGPVVGRTNLPLLLDSLGPDWAVWAAPPQPGADLPTLVAAVRVTAPPEDQARAEQLIRQSGEFVFTLARLAYNSRHIDQIEQREGTDPTTGIVVRYLTNDVGFPAGFRPAFALIRGYLVCGTDPEAVRRFTPPRAEKPPAGSEAVFARLSGPACRDYLLAHGGALAKHLAEWGWHDPKELAEGLATLAELLELIDSAVLSGRDIDAGSRYVLRLKLARPLRK